MERWIVTLASPEQALPEIKAKIVLHEGQQTRRQRLLVRDMTPDCLWQMRDHEGVQDVEVHTPSLEEIFVGLMKSSRAGDSQRYGSRWTRLCLVSGRAAGPGICWETRGSEFRVG
jgi:hypothetical protein